MEDSITNATLALPTNLGISFVKVSEVLYCKASGNYTEIFLIGGKKYLITRQIGKYEQMLRNYDFLRIHNSFLVNVNQIRNYIKGDGGWVVMSDNVSLNVARRRKKSFIKYMENRSLNTE
jgi:two-component system LytT family response regulator